ncbi:LADA_0A05842g1_1 [Lachancea dasiensis]|uniref:LADA_0A05842g1_1 n=1 Tax=Lachancea dasiensis TaxID=1072105 RepID=A0A1G4IP44_9SACH|nr:LADA_0A05842g1_1 [Lachancea dasiensis]
MCHSQDESSDLSELVIALAIVKHRNPTLWNEVISNYVCNSNSVHALSKSAKLQVSDGTSAAKKAQGNASITLAHVEPYLYKYVLSGSSGYLDSVSQFLNGHRLRFRELVADLDKVEALTSDLPNSMISKEIAPNYKVLKWLCAVSSPTKERCFTAVHVVQTFQLVLVSYYAFSVDVKKTVMDVCQGFIYKFIKLEVVGFGSSNPRVIKLLRSHTSLDSVEVGHRSFNKLCNNHIKLIILIVKIFIHKERYSAVIDIVGFVLKVIESLVVCLIKLECPSNSRDTRRAFEDIYKTRSTKMSYKMVTEILNASHHLIVGEAVKRIKICLEFCLTLIGSLNLRATFGDNKLRGFQFLQEYRQYILSGFLTLDNLELTTKFLHIAWPEVKE